MAILRGFNPVTGDSIGPSGKTEVLRVCPETRKVLLDLGPLIGKSWAEPRKKNLPIPLLGVKVTYYIRPMGVYYVWDI